VFLLVLSLLPLLVLLSGGRLIVLLLWLLLWLLLLLLIISRWVLHVLYSTFRTVEVLWLKYPTGNSTDNIVPGERGTMLMIHLGLFLGTDGYSICAK
jgi:hypothetical protein